MKKIVITSLLAILLPIFSFAQENVDVENEIIENEWAEAKVANAEVECFDYYTFQSVNVAVSPSKEIFQPGEKMIFSGTIANDNKYPIVDGNLFVRISEYNDNFFKEGHYIIDEFFALENVSLEATSAKNVSFEWNVPVEASKGDYHVDYFFSVGKKFNLGGLPFSNEVVAGVSAFKVDSVNENYFSFDRGGTKINSEKYQQIGNWPIVKKDEQVVVSHKLNNTRPYDINAMVTFDLYFWDSLLKEDKIETKQVSVFVPSGGSEEVTYTISNATESVYYLNTVAQQGNLKSIVNTRFVTEGGERARLNYPSITKFPIKAGDEFTLFSCFHNTTYTSTEGFVSVKISDKKGDEVAQETYEGFISSAMSAIKKDVTAQKDYDYLKLYAEIKDKDGNLIDEYETEFTCEKIGSCEKKGGAVETVKENTIMRTIAFGVLIFVLLIVIAALFKVVGNKKNFAGVFFILFAFALFGFSNHVEAGTWSVNSAKGYVHGSKKESKGNDTIFRYNVASGAVTLQNSITGGNSLICGGSVSYTYNPVLVFSASAGSWDTPYGAVCSGSALNCFNKSESQGITDTSDKKHSGSIKWISQRPSVTLSSSNNSIVKCSGMTCTAQPGKSGTVTITASFSSVWSQIYSYIMMKPCHKLGTSCPDCEETASRYDFWHSPSDESYGVASGCIKSDYHSRMQYDGLWHNGTNRMSLNRSYVSWNVTVASCIEDGACNSSSTRNDYPYTATSPSTPLCSAGTEPVVVPEFSGYGVASEVTWTCSGIGGGTDSPVCRAQRMPPPECACNSAINGQIFNYLQTSWPGALCSEGSIVGTVPDFPSIGSSVSWQCGGPTCSNGPVDCSASRSNPPECLCGPADQSVQQSMPTGADACTVGDQAVVSSSGGFEWTCGTENSADGPFGLCTSQKTCTEDCIEANLDVPSSIYLNNDDEGTFKARVRISQPQNVDGGTCDITVNGTTQVVTVTSGQEYTPYTDDDFVYTGSEATVSAVCDLEIDCGNIGSPSSRTITLGDRSVRSVCAERSCNSQGTCQITPRSGISSSSECSSTCTSNSDCSKGRMIETRP